MELVPRKSANENAIFRWMADERGDANEHVNCMDFYLQAAREDIFLS